ncbi:MAG: glycosyltransferase family 4 protein [Pseudomonadota bacterium]
MKGKSSKPHILLITRNLPPLIGGMEKLIHRIALGISQYSDLTIIGPKGCSQHLPNHIKTIEAPKNLAPFLFLSTSFAIRELRAGRYDLLIGGSGITALTLYLLNRMFGHRTIIYLHGLDLVVDSTIYQKVFIPCIRTMNSIIVNSQNTKNLALSKMVNESKITIIHPGTDLPPLPDSSTLDAFKQKFQIEFEYTMIFVGRFTRRKGLSMFIENSLPNILAALPSAGLIVIGRAPGDSLNQQGEEQRVAQLASNPLVRERIKFLGQVDDEELAHCYALADVSIFPLVHVKGDVEGFGMVAVEAAALGTPTVAFDTGGVADAISNANGMLISPGNYPEFSAAVLQILTGQKPGTASCLEHASQFAWDRVNDRFKEVVLESTT